MPLVCKYIALHVHDLRRAVELYGPTFGMQVALRETERDGEWWTVPHDASWDDVAAGGVDVQMAALRRDELVLVLFRGAPTSGTVYEISLGLPRDEIERLEADLPDDVQVIERGDAFLRFDDPFGFRWVVQPEDAKFRSSGEIAGRWLEV